jgi:hypothetical protein
MRVSFAWSPVPGPLRHELGLAGVAEPPLLLTWEKTWLTARYEVEVASDPGFRNIVYRTVDRLNFQVMRARNTGRYYWRIRGLGESTQSPWTKVATFTVK